MLPFRLNIVDLFAFIIWIAIIGAITTIFRLKSRGFLARLFVSLLIIPLPLFLYILFVKHFNIFQYITNVIYLKGATGLIVLVAVIGVVGYNLFLMLAPD